MIGGPVGSVVCLLLYAYLIVLVVKAVLSWFPIDYDSPLQKVRHVLDAMTEPVLTPLRKVIPALQIGGIGLDMSFMVLFLGIVILQQVICGR
ncbi:MAG: YggT family protein [Acidimicrobiia bacterium]